MSQNLKYQFVITEFDKKTKEVRLEIKLTTKSVTAKRAGELLKESLARYTGKDYPFCYSVIQGGRIVSTKDLK